MARIGLFGIQKLIFACLVKASGGKFLLCQSASWIPACRVYLKQEWKECFLFSKIKLVGENICRASFLHPLNWKNF